MTECVVANAGFFTSRLLSLWRYWQSSALIVERRDSQRQTHLVQRTFSDGCEAVCASGCRIRYAVGAERPGGCAWVLPAWLPGTDSRGGYVRLEEAWRTCVGDKKSGGKLKRRVWRKGKYVGSMLWIAPALHWESASSWWMEKSGGKRENVRERVCVCASSQNGLWLCSLAWTGRSSCHPSFDIMIHG